MQSYSGLFKIALAEVAMTSDKEHNKNSTANDSSKKPDENEAGLDSDLEFAEQAIEQAFEEDQQRQTERRDQQLAETEAEKELFANMALEGDAAEAEGLPCLNCNTPLRGPYCYECGQPERHFIRFFPRVLWDMINEAFDLDSKIFNTILPLMFKPGRLTLEYIAGRRARYINPLRMYIVISLIFFLVLEFSDSFNEVNVGTSESGVKSRVTISDDAVQIEEDTSADSAADERRQQIQDRIDELQEAREGGAQIPDSVITELEKELNNDRPVSRNNATQDSDDDLTVTLDDGTEWHPETNPVKFNNLFSAEVTQKLNAFLWELKNKTKMVEEDPGGFAEEILNVLPGLMFVLLPIFALLLKIVYIFKKRYYMEHLIVALHSHSFMFFSLLMIFLVSALSDIAPRDSWARDTFELLFVLLWLWIPINLFIQQKRVYAQGKIMTTIKFLMVGISYIALLVVTAGAAAVLGLYNL